MGMAHQAPKARYNCKHAISHHAVERFRERVEEDMKCRSNADLSNLLDEKVCQATQVYTVRDQRAPEAITKLHEIELRSGTYYAVVRDLTVVTVLDQTMVKDNYDLSYTHTLNAPFADKLRNLQLTPRKLTPTEQAIASGALSPPSPAPVVEIALPVSGTCYQPTPLEAAGMQHARARKRHRECEQALARAKQDVIDAEAALQAANTERAEAEQALNAVIEG